MPALPVRRQLEIPVGDNRKSRIRAAEQLFRHKVIRLLQRTGLLDEDRTRPLLSWHHSSFSVHNFVTVAAGDGRALDVRRSGPVRTAQPRQPRPLLRARIKLPAILSCVLLRNGISSFDELLEYLRFARVIRADNVVFRQLMGNVPSGTFRMLLSGVSVETGLPRRFFWRLSLPRRGGGRIISPVVNSGLPGRHHR